MKCQMYKWLRPGGVPANGGNGRWHLPHGGEPGQWMPRIEGELIPCQRGYHLCRVADLPYWIGPSLYVVEARAPSYAAITRW